MQINSADQMFDFGKQISQKYKKILLYGELGAGKTHFVKGFADGIGISPDLINSPTYTYVNIYQNRLLHIDLYRLNSIEELNEKGILDLINNFEYICIERPKGENFYFDSNWIKIKIEKISENIRNIIF